MKSPSRKRSPCDSSQVRRQRDNKCLKRRSKQGKYVLRARKASRTRNARQECNILQVRRQRDNKCLDMDSKEGKYVLRARRASRTRRLRSLPAVMDDIPLYDNVPLSGIF